MADQETAPALNEADANTEDQLADVIASDESEEAFGDAFAEASADEGLVDIEPEPDEDEIEPEPVVSTGPKDIWADATPEQQAAIEAAKHETSSNKGRLSAQDRELKKLRDLLASAETPAPKEAEVDVDWDEFNDEYPDVAGPVAKRLSALEADNKRLNNEVSGITEASREEAINDEKAVLLDRHPDYLEFTRTEEFVDWLNDQQTYVQDGFIRHSDGIVDGSEAADLLDLYTGSAQPKTEAYTPKPPSRRQRRLDSAVTTDGGTPGSGAGASENDFSAAFKIRSEQKAS